MRSKRSLAAVIALFIILIHPPTYGATKGETAPSWQGVQWINLEPGKTTLEVDELRGKVIYLSFFQSW